MKDNMIKRLDDFFQNPSDTSLFMENGYLRFNMLYLSPFTLYRFKEKLLSMGMKLWRVDKIGVKFNFLMKKKDEDVHFEILFKGKYTFYKEKNVNEIEEDTIETELLEKYPTKVSKNEEKVSRNDFNYKIFCVELDFEPQVNNKDVYNVLYEIESYLKGLDTIFFMYYSVNIDEEIMHNPLSHSVEYLYKIIKERKRF